jgi:hypothetical protein
LDLLRDLLRLVLLGAINHQITHIVVRGSIFESTRQRCKELDPKLGQLVTCSLCFGTWIGMLMALLFRPKVVESFQHGRRLPGPPTVQRIAAFLADAFVIALFGRFFTEILAILANKVSVEQRRQELIETQIQQAERSGPPASRA